MDINTNFIAGRMNKSVDERLIPPGEYKNALNVRLGSTETTDIGAVENSKGNTKLTTLEYGGNPLSINATCLGAYADSIRETMYWFIHDNNPNGPTVNIIASYNSITAITIYHVVSLRVLNFNPKYLITGVQLVEDLLFFTDNFNPPRVINITRNYPLPASGVDSFVEDDISLIVKPPGYSSFINSLGITEFDLAVPKITLNETSDNQENFLDDRFVSFAYRYRYLDKQYSATSLFSPIAFEPKAFNIEPEAMINEGMVNRYNSATIEYSTGPENVLEIELLYKDSNSNVIYIIENFVKSELGWNDNERKEFQFSASKVYGTLGSDELLRQYDNVPQLAQSLTIQGNRVMLGNYTEGYNISTLNGQKIPINFTSTLSSDPTTTLTLPGPFSLKNTANVPNTITYSIIPSLPIGTTFDVGPEKYSRIVFDLATVSLPIENGIEFQFPMQFYSISNTNADGAVLPSNYEPIGSAITPVNLTFSYTAIQRFDSVAEMLDHVSFRTAIGEYVDPTTAIATAGTGGTFMDRFNRFMTIQASIRNMNNGYQDRYSYTFLGISSPTNEQILQYSGPIPSIFGGSGATTCFSVVLPGVRFTRDSLTSSVPTAPAFIFNIFRFVLIDAVTNIPTPYSPLLPNVTESLFVSSNNLISKRSLHSNRDYESAIVYMDDYGRASTALVSTNNVVFIPASSSIDTNSINITLSNKPPFWAKKYKFVLKPSRATYNIIYCTRFYQDPNDTSIKWFALEGEDKALVKEGTQLIVKRDQNGEIDKVEIATVLDVESKSRGDLITDQSLPGLYMSIKTNNFSANVIDSDTINFGKNPTEGDLEGGARQDTWVSNDDGPNNGPFNNYPLPQIFNETIGQWELAPIPQGSVIKINFRVWRSKWDPFIGSSDDSFDWSWTQTFVVPEPYDDFKAWWIGENIDSYAGGNSNVGQGKIELPPEFDIPTGAWINGLPTGPGATDVRDAGATVSQLHGIKYTMFEITTPSPITNPGRYPYQFFLQLRARLGRGGNFTDQRPSHVDMSIQFYGQDNLLIFETLPPDADPNLFYDSSEMYDISPDLNGDLAHIGNLQDQIIASQIPAKIKLPFFNCYSFSNGAESYQIEDSAIGKSLVLGQRTTAISNLPYAKQLRQSSITYSGIYYPSSGLNNSNEFNLGLANFSDLETNFGPVMKLHSRETDILVLQEDRISYVLTGKNIISDSVGGGAIVSVPEVLGKQIARIEEYGISFNPESFSAWGKNIYFSDTKRGAIIQLSGGAVNNEALTIISDTGMRSYFRDKFISQLNTQKLGGYDPYMDEYVFSSNTKLIPVTTPNSPCGRNLNPQSQSSSYNVTIEVGALVGEFNIGFFINSPSTATLDIKATFNGVITEELGLSNSGNVKVQKTSIFPTTVDIIVTPSEKCNYSLSPKCIDSRQDTFVTQYVLTAAPRIFNPTFHFGYNWTDGVYDSPESNNLAQNTPTAFRDCLPATGILSIVSDSGVASSGVIPYAGTTINMFVDKEDGDNIIFDPARGHKMYAYTQRTIIEGCKDDLLSTLTNLTPLTVLNIQGNKYVGSLANLPITNSLYSDTNSAVAPVNYIARLFPSGDPNFTDFTLNINDIVVSASGVTGLIEDVQPNLMKTKTTLGVSATIVNPGEAYTIKRRNIPQVILVYDMRNKTGVTGCQDDDGSTVCSCNGLCTPIITTANTQSTPLNACLESQIGSLIGKSHSGATPIPTVGNVIFNAPIGVSCSPTNVATNGWYWVTDQYSNPSTQVMQVLNGICVAIQTQNC